MYHISHNHHIHIIYAGTDIKCFAFELAGQKTQRSHFSRLLTFAFYIKFSKRLDLNWKIESQSFLPHHLKKKALYMHSDFEHAHYPKRMLGFGFQKCLIQLLCHVLISPAEFNPRILQMIHKNLRARDW
jgi:hypothetical protein